MYIIPYSGRGVQFSQMDILVIFRGSIFADAHDRAITSMYKQAYFVGLIIAVHDNRVNHENWTPRKFPTIQYYARLTIEVSEEGHKSVDDNLICPAP